MSANKVIITNSDGDSLVTFDRQVEQLQLTGSAKIIGSIPSYASTIRLNEEAMALHSLSSPPLEIGAVENSTIVIGGSESRVGLGTHNPQFQLDVVGDVRATQAVRTPTVRVGETTRITTDDSLLGGGILKVVNAENNVSEIHVDSVRVGQGNDYSRIIADEIGIRVLNKDGYLADIRVREILVGTSDIKMSLSEITGNIFFDKGLDIEGGYTSLLHGSLNPETFMLNFRGPDAGTGIYFLDTSSQVMRFAVAGVERASIHATGLTLDGRLTATSFTGDGTEITGVTVAGVANVTGLQGVLDDLVIKGVANVTGLQDALDLKVDRNHTGDVSITGNLTATTFVGDGAGISNVSVDGINNVGGLQFALDNLVLGGIPDVPGLQDALDLKVSNIHTGNVSVDGNVAITGVLSAGRIEYPDYWNQRSEIGRLESGFGTNVGLTTTRIIASLPDTNTIFIYDRETSGVIHTITSPATNHLSVSEDGSKLIISRDANVAVYSWNGTVYAEEQLIPEPFGIGQVSKDGNTIVIGAPRYGIFEIATSHPEIAMTSNVSSEATVSSSSDILNHEPWKAFNKVVNTDWMNSWWTTYSYAGTSTTVGYTQGEYIGNNGTFTTDGNEYRGDWLQIQFNQAVKISGYVLQSLVSSEEPFSPVQWAILGSTDGGLSWSLVDTRENLILTTLETTLTVQLETTDKSYSTYRLVVMKNKGNENISHSGIGEFEILSPEINDHDVGIMYKYTVVSGTWTRTGTVASNIIVGDARMGQVVAVSETGTVLATPVVGSGSVVVHRDNTPFIVTPTDIPKVFEQMNMFESPTAVEAYGSISEHRIAMMSNGNVYVYHRFTRELLQTITIGSSSVSMTSDGNVMVIGVPTTKAVRIYKWNSITNVYDYDQEIIDSSIGSDGTNMNIRISSDGKLIVIGFPNYTRDEVMFAGIAYTYITVDSITWSLSSTISDTGFINDENLGRSVDTSSDGSVVAAASFTIPVRIRRSNVVHDVAGFVGDRVSVSPSGNILCASSSTDTTIARWDSVGLTYTIDQSLLGHTGFPRFMNDTTIILGKTSSVDVWMYNGTTWEQTYTIPIESTVWYIDVFGNSFVTGITSRVYEHRLTNDIGVSADMTLDGAIVAVSGKNSIYVVSWDDTLGIYKNEQTVATGGILRFISNDMFIVGLPELNKIQVWKKITGVWIFDEDITAGTPIVGGRFGRDISTISGAIVVGGVGRVYDILRASLTQTLANLPDINALINTRVRQVPFILGNLNLDTLGSQENIMNIGSFPDGVYEVSWKATASDGFRGIFGKTQFEWYASTQTVVLDQLIIWSTGRIKVVGTDIVFVNNTRPFRTITSVSGYLIQIA